MKAVLGIIGLLAVLGIVYGLAFVGILPAQKWANGSPALGKTLIALHLAKSRPKAAQPIAATRPASPSPDQAALDAERQQVAADRAQLEKDKAAFEAQQQQALAAPAPDVPAGPDPHAKLIALYGTMDADDLARIFSKLPDPQVVGALVLLDEKKAGQVFAALPPDRAARLSQIMASRTTTRSASALPPPAPATAL